MIALDTIPSPPSAVVSPWRNTPDHYGRLARWLHWGTAMLLLGSYASIYYREWFTQRGTDANLDSREGARANLHNEIAERFGQYAPAVARQEQAFGYPAPSPTEPAAKPLNRHGNPRVNPRLSARFAEWIMGAPPGWITDTPGVTRNEALRMAGNGVVRQQALAALTDMQRFVPAGTDTYAHRPIREASA